MNNSHGLTLKEIMEALDKVDCLSEKKKIEIKTKKFYEFVKWEDKTLEQYENLYKEFLKANKNKSGVKKSKGDALEDLVNYIFENSFFLEVYPNKRTSTNEIDQFIKISDYGELALNEYNWPISMLGLEQKYILCECKNYDTSVAATWVGKFNTLMETCGDCQLGIIFSYHGLSGKENNWYDAHGLTKIIYKMRLDDKKRFILDFNKDDFKLLLDKRNNIFNIIKAKKDALILGVKSYNFLKEIHDGQAEMVNIYNEIK